jgi:hypothetical protein
MIPAGAFVYCNFPFGHPASARSRPGPSAHIAYCLGREPGSIMLAYTSSGPWRGSAPTRPLGIVEFTTAEAQPLNQKAFHLDLRCLARVEPAETWFPRWRDDGHGIVAMADAGTQHRILSAARLLMSSSPEIIEIRGVTRR